MSSLVALFSTPKKAEKCAKNGRQECHCSRWFAAPCCHISLQVPVGALSGTSNLAPSRATHVAIFKPRQSHPTQIFNSNLRGEDMSRKSRTGFELRRKALGAQIRTRPPSKSEGKGSKFELELAYSARRFVFVRSARPDIPLRRTIPIFNDFPNFPVVKTPPT